jgi:RNA polymerase sigma factor (sigma-70 family)
LNKINQEEAMALLEELVTLRNKCQKSKSKRLHAKYQAARKKCVDTFDFLVDKKTWRYRSFANYEDLKQDGRVALMLALKSYDPGKGDFFWWADKYIKTKISREANRHSTIKIPIKHTKRLQPYKVSQLPVIIDSGPGADDNIYTTQVNDRVHAAINKLPDKQRKVIKMYFEMDGRQSGSINKICKQLKISRMNCLKIFNEAKQTLKRELENLD